MLFRLPGLHGPVWLSRLLARVLHDMAVFIERTAEAVDSDPQTAVDVVGARLRDQLGREPSAEEIRRLVVLLDGLQSALSLSNGELARARDVLSSYAEGLRARA